MSGAIEKLRAAAQTHGAKVSMSRLAGYANIAQHRLEAFIDGEDLPAEQLSALTEIIFEGHFDLDLQTDTLHSKGGKAAQMSGISIEAQRGTEKYDWRNPKPLVLREVR